MRFPFFRLPTISVMKLPIQERKGFYLDLFNGLLFVPTNNMLTVGFCDHENTRNPCLFSASPRNQLKPGLLAPWINPPILLQGLRMTRPILESFRFCPAAVDADVPKSPLQSLRSAAPWWLTGSKGRPQYNIGLGWDFINISSIISSWSVLCYMPLFLLLQSTLS